MKFRAMPSEAKRDRAAAFATQQRWLKKQKSLGNVQVSLFLPEEFKKPLQVFCDLLRQREMPVRSCFNAAFKDHLKK